MTPSHRPPRHGAAAARTERVGPNNTAMRAAFNARVGAAAASAVWELDPALYATLLRHPVDSAFVLRTTLGMKDAELRAPARAMMSRLLDTLFTARDAPSEVPESSLVHALQLAAATLRAVVSRRFVDHNWGMVELLCGMDKSEAFLRRWIVALASVLANPQRTPAAKSAAVLCLFIFACANRTPTANMFLDFFALEARTLLPALVRCAAERGLRRTAGRDAAALLVVLALSKRGEARNVFASGWRALHRRAAGGYSSSYGFSSRGFGSAVSLAGSSTHERLGRGDSGASLEGHFLEDDIDSVVDDVVLDDDRLGAGIFAPSAMRTMWGTRDTARRVAAEVNHAVTLLCSSCTDAVMALQLSSGMAVAAPGTRPAPPPATLGQAAKTGGAALGSVVLGALSSAVSSLWSWGAGAPSGAAGGPAGGAVESLLGDEEGARAAALALKPPLWLRLRSHASVALLLFYDTACKSREGMRLATGADGWRAHAGGRPLPGVLPETVRQLLSLLSFALQTSDREHSARKDATGGRRSSAGSSSSAGGAGGSGGSSGTTGSSAAMVALLVLQRMCERGLSDAIAAAHGCATPASSGLSSPEPQRPGSPVPLSPVVDRDDVGSEAGTVDSYLGGGPGNGDEMLILLHASSLDADSLKLTLFKRASGGRMIHYTTESSRPPAAAVYRMVCNAIAVRLGPDLHYAHVSRAMDVLHRLLLYHAHVYRRVANHSVRASGIDHGDDEDRGVHLAVEWSYVVVTLLRVIRRVGTRDAFASMGSHGLALSRKAAVLLDITLCNVQGRDRVFAYYECVRQQSVLHPWLDLFELTASGSLRASRNSTGSASSAGGSGTGAGGAAGGGAGGGAGLSPRVSLALANIRAALRAVGDKLALYPGSLSQATVEKAVQLAEPWKSVAGSSGSDWTRDAYAPGFGFLTSVGFKRSRGSVGDGGGGRTPEASGRGTVNDGDGSAVFHAAYRCIVEDVRVALGMGGGEA